MKSFIPTPKDQTSNGLVQPQGLQGARLWLSIIGAKTSALAFDPCSLPKIISHTKMAAISSQQKPFLAGKKIIVAGAGVAGLSFVIALRKQWTALTSGLGSSLDPVTITVYERDTKEVTTEQGYSLFIRSDRYSGGMQALRRLGLLEPMLLSGIVLGDSFVYWDKDWNEILKFKGMSGSDSQLPFMRIERSVLQQILLDATPSGDTIHWATSCIGAVDLSNGKVQVSLSNGEVDECDLLIAADGANSKIRAGLRPKEKLSFTGAVCIAANSRFPDGVPKPVHRNFGSVMGGNGVGLVVVPMGENTAFWSLSYDAPEPVATLKPPLAQEQAHQLLEEALNRGKPFSEPFKTLLQATDLSTIWISSARDKNPFPHVYGNQKCQQVIFIGDSNHAMSPFAGNGVNMALMDGWELAEQLCNSSSLPAALTAYDASSMPRSKSAIRRSHLAISMMHAKGWKLTFYIFLLKLVKFLLFRR